MRTSRSLWAIIAIAAVTALASCSSIGVADSREEGIPAGAALPSDDEGPYVLATANGDVQVVTLGSTSCPPTATDFANDGTEMRIGFELAVGGTCTADIGPTTHTFSASTVGSTIPDVAHIEFPEIDEEYVVEVTRLE